MADQIGKTGRQGYQSGLPEKPNGREDVCIYVLENWVRNWLVHWCEVRSPVLCHLKTGDLGKQSPRNQEAYGGIHTSVRTGGDERRLQPMQD